MSTAQPHGSATVAVRPPPTTVGQERRSEERAGAVGNTEPNELNADARGIPEELAGGAEPHAPRLSYQEAFEFAADAQFVTDGRGVILEANFAATALLGCPKEFLVGKPLPLFGAEGYRSRFDDSLARLTNGEVSDTFDAAIAGRGAGVSEVSVVTRAGGSSVGGRATAQDQARLHWLLRDVTGWKRAEAARAELQRRLLTAQEDERRRIARDLHDSLGQTLTALLLALSATADTGPLPPATLERLDHARQLAYEMGRQLHDLATRLRPTVLDDIGLAAATRQLVSDWSASTGIAVDFQAPDVIRFPPEVETALYRMVQEALTNVARHAGASRVAVVIGRGDRCAVAVVEDDGVGFDVELVRTPTPGARTRLGLLGMRERVTLLGGTLEIESAPSTGTTIIARVPLSTPPFWPSPTQV